MRRSFVQICSAERWKLIDRADYVAPEPEVHYVMGDIKPYKAVTGDMQGQYITSRSKHRDYLKRNNLIEVGNEKAHFTRYGGMTEDNPVVQETLNPGKQEEAVCRTLITNLERLKK